MNEIAEESHRPCGSLRVRTEIPAPEPGAPTRSRAPTGARRPCLHRVAGLPRSEKDHCPCGNGLFVYQEVLDKNTRRNRAREARQPALSITLLAGGTNE